MWRDKHITFLSESESSEKEILQLLNDSKKTIKNSDDKIILDKIINNFEENDFSILSEIESNFFKRNSKSKWVEYLIHRSKFYFYENNHEMPDFPLYLILEPVSSCNLRCPFCMQVDENFTNDPKMMGMMEFELFKKIIDEAYDSGTRAITFTGRGEPTLHPQLGEMLEYCQDKFIEIKMNTNATMLNEKLIHKILKSKITDLVFSVDSYYKEEFESLRINANFEKVVANVTEFKRIKEEYYPNSACVTRVSGVQASETQDIKKFQSFWKPLVDFVVYVKMIDKWDLYKNSKDMMANSPCHYLGRNLSIYFDGSTNPCDVDYLGGLTLGNLKNNTIREIWNGEKYKKLFSSHKKNSRNEYFPCDRCPIGT